MCAGADDKRGQSLLLNEQIPARSHESWVQARCCLSNFEVKSVSSQIRGVEPLNLREFAPPDQEPSFRAKDYKKIRGTGAHTWLADQALE
jgi:hypothetical protein